jgi:hypothetical protein
MTKSESSNDLVAQTKYSLGLACRDASHTKWKRPAKTAEGHNIKKSNNSQSANPHPNPRKHPPNYTRDTPEKPSICPRIRER